MRMRAIQFLCCPAIVVQLSAQIAVHHRQHFAPPAPPPLVEHQGAEALPSALTAAATLYSIGEPTPEEQLYVEFINRARANPVGEAEILAGTDDLGTLEDYDFFEVDLALLRAEFAVIPAAPPVAPNARLTEAARRHSSDMLLHSFQDHTGRDGSTLVDRIRDANYRYFTAGENIYANAESVFHGHAGFEVDWGYGEGGMQPARGHRRTIHNPEFREVGIGVVFGTNQPAPGDTGPEYHEVGPQLVTQDFGTVQFSTPLITGVAYYDLNGNNFYDLDEGIGGVTVTAEGSTFMAVTSKSGGYAVPVPTNGQFTVTFSGAGFAPVFRTVVVTQMWNQKLDFVPAYTPPAVLGAATPATNRLNTYTITAVPGATAYQWRHFQLISPAIEGAERGAARVTIQQSGDYNVIDSNTRANGSFGFHLVHVEPANQSVTLNPTYLVGSNSVLRFQSRLGYSTANQFATVKISTDDGASWREIYRQPGKNGAGETSFSLKELSLAEFAGASIKVRFEYARQNGAFYFQEDPASGWSFDDILVANASQISNEQMANTAGTSFQFQPDAIGEYVLQARAQTGFSYLPWGAALSVQSVESLPLPSQLDIGAVSLGGGKFSLELEVTGGNAPNLVLQFKENLDGAWSMISAETQAISANRYRLSAAVAAQARTGFFRVLAN